MLATVPRAVAFTIVWPEGAVWFTLTESYLHQMLATTVNFPFMATENCTLSGFWEVVDDAPICWGDGQKGAWADARMGDADVAEGVDVRKNPDFVLRATSRTR